jgi:hypothetical protein
MPVFLAIQEAKIGIWAGSQHGQFAKPYLEKTIIRKGLAMWIR